MAPPDVTLRRLNRTTLARQGLLDRLRGPVPDAIGRLAGLQAQHANSPYIALWSRLADFEIRDLVGALDDRSVVKATLMRSTLHLVDAAGYPVLEAATRGSRTENWAPTVRRSGIDDKALHEHVLAFAGTPRTVAELEAFAEEDAAAGSTGSSLADHAPGNVARVAFRIASARGGLVHAPPSGHWRSHGKARYVAARVWLPDVAIPDEEPALDESLVGYLRAYGPASVADFGQWFGQRRVSRTKAAVERLGDRLVRLRDENGRELLDLAELDAATGDEPAPVRFLARWDSLLVSYDARLRIVADEHRPAVYKKNADILATFLVDGFVAGTWTSEVAKGVATIDLVPLGRIAPSERQALTDEAERLIRFIEPDADRHEVRWTEG
ncbi:MAG TPA: winged helix DNA-binding domain-containing protein [Candidatus Limnocylindrales bacterium]|nr:winged helix DNA-binding domain-containing protein [Candidatus Limnocylindrales bacterium]